MTARVAAGLRALQAVAGRTDPTLSVAAGEIARTIAMPLSTVSRLCAELVGLGLLARGDAYGSYRVGEVALALSGRASSPYARVCRTVLTRIAHRTGETAVLAAPTPEGMRVVGAVVSPWTLHSPAEVGELVVDRPSAIARAGSEEETTSGGGRVVETTVGKSVEIAVPILAPGGDALAVVAVRLPMNRGRQGIAVARKAVLAARREVERVVDARGQTASPSVPVAMSSPPASPPAPALAATLDMLWALSSGPRPLAELARAAGIRRDRAVRLLETCRRSGVVRIEEGEGLVSLEWSIHGWQRAALASRLVAEGTPVVARTADRAGVCAFITVLRGMRSVTLVEELRHTGPGLEMTPWLGRPCPILSSDGGPALVLAFDDDDIGAFLPARVDARESAEFFQRVHLLGRDGVMARESFEEAGQTAFTAPIRDSSGAVVAAACLVGASDEMRPRVAELSDAVHTMAAEVSILVGFGAEYPGGAVPTR